jgi:hypothetical protein
MRRSASGEAVGLSPKVCRGLRAYSFFGCKQRTDLPRRPKKEEGFF